MNPTLVAIAKMPARALTTSPRKEAYSYALEASAVLNTVSTAEIATDQMEGLSGLMNRLAEAVHEAIVSDDETRRGQVCNELQMVLLLVAQKAKEHDEGLLYAAETLIDLTIVHLRAMGGMSLQEYNHELEGAM